MQQTSYCLYSEKTAEFYHFKQALNAVYTPTTFCCYLCFCIFVVEYNCWNY